MSAEEGQVDTLGASEVPFGQILVGLKAGNVLGIVDARGTV